MKTAPTQEFLENCDAAGFDLSDEQLGQLQCFLETLYTFNQHTNLTSIKSMEEAWMRHIFDSLWFNPFLAGVNRIVDVGSGGGLPAFPIAIMNPDAEVVCIEATQKKCNFLDQAAAEVGLENLSAWWGRAEELGQNGDFREQFDVVTARAVKALPVLLELTTPFLKVDGLLVAAKGAKAQEELASAERAIQALQLSEPHIEIGLHGLPPEACRMLFKKEHHTPDKYPRSAGEMGQKPL